MYSFRMGEECEVSNANYNFKNSVGLCAFALHQSSKTQMLQNTCLSFMTNMLLSPPTRPLAILFLCVNYIT